MLKKIETALWCSGKYPETILVSDIDCLDAARGIYYVWLNFKENFSMKILVTISENPDGTVTLLN